MSTRHIARRVMREIVRDRRTLAFFFVVPLAVMTLVYYALAAEEVARIEVIARGPSRLFDADLRNSLRESDDIEVVTTDIPDDVHDRKALEAHFRRVLLTHQADAVLYVPPDLLPDRVELRRGTLHLYVEGSRPSRTALVMSGIKDATDSLADALPVVIDSQCSAHCANSVNAKPLDVEEHYAFGSDDNDAVDFYLPVLPPFFVFFFTFILSTIAFQRERVRGTLERLLVAPISFLNVISGYVGGFFLFASVQALIVVGYFLALTTFEVGPVQLLSLAVVVALCLVTALLLGLLASFLAHNEFQALQFIPLVILPQIFLSDIIWDIATFPVAFRVLSLALPLTHANFAVRDVLIRARGPLEIAPQLCVLLGFVIALYGLLTLVGRRVRL